MSLQLSREELLRLEMKQINRRLAETIKQSQDSCPHMQGSVSPSWGGGNTAIVHHLFDDGVVRGLCLECFRIFNPSDNDYREWMLKRSGCLPSSAGTVVLNVSQEEYEEGIKDQFCPWDNDDLYETNPEDLKVLEQAIRLQKILSEAKATTEYLKGTTL